MLGLIGFYRKFIEGFEKTAEPFYQFHIKSENFFFNGACKEALKGLKEKLEQAPVLGYVNDEDMHTLTTDASITGIEARLTQKQQGMDRVRQQNAE